jgi:hypothetical protein
MNDGVSVYPANESKVGGKSMFKIETVEVLLAPAQGV